MNDPKERKQAAHFPPHMKLAAAAAISGIVSGVFVSSPACAQWRSAARETSVVTTTTQETVRIGRVRYNPVRALLHPSWVFILDDQNIWHRESYWPGMEIRRLDAYYGYGLFDPYFGVVIPFVFGLIVSFDRYNRPLFYYDRQIVINRYFSGREIITRTVMTHPRTFFTFSPEALPVPAARGHRHVVVPLPVSQVIPPKRYPEHRAIIRSPRIQNAPAVPGRGNVMRQHHSHERKITPYPPGNHRAPIQSRYYFPANRHP